MISRKLSLLLFASLLVSGCSGAAVLFGTIWPVGTPAAGSVDLGVAVVLPVAATEAPLGTEASIQWADVARTQGTVVRVSAQRQDADHEDVGDPVHLIGDGTPGSGRDALADGASDAYTWDVTGVRVGDYVIVVTIEAPDGTTATVRSRDDDLGTSGVFTVTTTLPAPTLTFTAPGSADETVAAGDPFTITWTDNGVENADAVLLLGLDSDADHDNGNEVVLVRDEPLSTDDDAGQFVFNHVDENGIAVADGTYTVFALLDDGANDPVTVAATGRLILTP